MADPTFEQPDEPSDIDRLVKRTLDGVAMIARKATRFTTILLLIVTFVCLCGFLLGMAALSGGIQSVWIVLGIVFGAIAIGSAFLARWRVGSVRRHVPELADEVRSMISEGTDTTRSVIDTFVVDIDGDGVGGDPDAGSALTLSRQMYGFKSIVGSGVESTARLTAAVTALTTFPVLVLAALAISAVFSFLGLIFLIALAL